MSLREINLILATPFVPPKMKVIVPALNFEDVLMLTKGETVLLTYPDPAKQRKTLPIGTLATFDSYFYNNAVVPFIRVEGLQYAIRRNDVWEFLPEPVMDIDVIRGEELYRQVMEKTAQLRKIYRDYYNTTDEELMKGMMNEVVPVVTNLSVPLVRRVEALISYVFSLVFAAPYVQRVDVQVLFSDTTEYFCSKLSWTVSKILERLSEVLDLTMRFHKQYYDIKVKAEEEQRRQQNIYLYEVLKRVLDKEFQSLVPRKTRDNRIAKLRELFEEKKPFLPPDAVAYIEENLPLLEEQRYLSSAEEAPLYRHLSFLLELPWGKSSEEPPMDLDEAERFLNKRFYGMKIVKERLLDILFTMRRLNLPSLRGRILCLVGPAGVGKTALSLCLSEILRRPLQKVNVGGISDESEIRGHRRTYVGATAGRLMEAIRRAQVNNPIIVLEEIDKLHHGGYKGDPIAALMEALDPEQNHMFTDHYVDFPFDLSKVFFIATANDADLIFPPLRDRMEILYLRPYFINEKVIILKDYILPRVYNELQVDQKDVPITEETLRWMVINYSLGGGVRNLERDSRLIIERHLRRRPSQPVKEEHIIEYLMEPPRPPYKKLDEPTVGVAPVLSVTSSGDGVVEFVQVSEQPLGNQHTFSGGLKEVPKESSMVAYLLVQKFVQFSKPVHVHMTSMAVQKEGPSGGLSTFCALYSFVTQKPLPSDWAFTGEIDLLGNVHPVGGIAPKLVAAELAGFKTVFLPEGNRKDVELLEFPVSLDLKFVKNVKEVVDLIEKYHETGGEEPRGTEKEKGSSKTTRRTKGAN